MSRHGTTKRKSEVIEKGSEAELRLGEEQGVSAAINVVFSLHCFLEGWRKSKSHSRSLQANAWNLKTPFKGVKNDFNGRIAYYKMDWLDTCCSEARILAPTA